MPSEQHLSWRPAVDINNRGLFRCRGSCRFKQLTMNRKSIRRFECYLFGNHQALLRKLFWYQLLSNQLERRLTAWVYDAEYWRTLGRCTDANNTCSITGEYRRPLKSGARCEHF